jgi:hypothetical protein
MECEEAGPLQQAVVAWLEGYASLLQQPGCLLLEVDVLELAAGQQHPEIVAALLENPGACPARAHSSLLSLHLLDSPCSWQQSTQRAMPLCTGPAACRAPAAGGRRGAVGGRPTDRRAARVAAAAAANCCSRA